MTSSPEIGVLKPTQLTLPLVSVCVVCYNHAPFLRACLDSVLRQTYPRLQLLVVDNVSTDSSRDVIDAFAAELPSLRADVAFEKIFSQVNGHETGAVVQGFARATGHYVMFIDGDDLLLPTNVETHVKAHLVSRIPVGVTSVDMYQSDGDDIVVGSGTLLSRFVASGTGRRADLCRMSNLAAFDFGRDPAPLAPEDLHYLPPSRANEWVWSPSTGLCFRREAVSLMLDPTPTLRAGADNFLVRGITALTGGIVIDRALAVYRMHGANLLTRHPALANFYPFDPGQRDSLDKDVMPAIVACYRARLADLANRLEDPDIFVTALDHFGSIAPGLAGSEHSSFTLRFLRENRAAVIASFGAARYRKWMTRRLRPADVVRVIAGKKS